MSAEASAEQSQHHQQRQGLLHGGSGSGGGASDGGGASPGVLGVGGGPRLKRGAFDDPSCSESCAGMLYREMATAVADAQLIPAASERTWSAF